MPEVDLIRRISSDPPMFGGKPIVRGKRLAVEHVLSMLAAGDTAQDLVAAYPFLEPDDIRACILYAYKLVAHERIDPFPVGSAASECCWTAASPGKPPNWFDKRGTPLMDTSHRLDTISL